MSEKEKGKAEEAAEKSGDVVGKIMKKSFGVVKPLGKVAEETVIEKREGKKE